MHERLCSLGLSSAVLSPAAASNLQTIAAVAQELRLEGCHENMVLLAVTQLRLFLNMYAASFLLICDHVSTHGTPVEDCCLVLWVMLHVYVSYLNIAY